MSDSSESNVKRIKIDNNDGDHDDLTTMKNNDDNNHNYHENEINDENDMSFNTMNKSKQQQRHDEEEDNDKDIHVHVLVSLEYHGTDYGGWQRQGPNNKINYPSIQGTLEKATTKVCHLFVRQKTKESSTLLPVITMIPTTRTTTTNRPTITKEEQELEKDNDDDDDDDCFRAVMAGNSGRTDRGVHALEHYCLLRLPFAKASLYDRTTGLYDFLMGATTAATASTTTATSSPFLITLNYILPTTIRVLSCQTISQQQRKKLRFVRKRYRYMLQQAPSYKNRPYMPWNNYTYFIKHPLDITKLQIALNYMIGTQNFLYLSCHKNDVNKPNSTTIRTIYNAKVTVINYPFSKDTCNTDNKDNYESDSDNQRIPWFQKAFVDATKQPSDKKKKKKNQEKDDHDDGDANTNTNTADENAANDNDVTILFTDNNKKPTSIFSPPYYGESSLHQQQETTKTTTTIAQDEEGEERKSNNIQQPNDYTLICIEIEGNGFLRHQIRRMISVLIKVGHGIWDPECVLRILQDDKNDDNNNSSNRINKDKQLIKAHSLAPARALWKVKVWIGEKKYQRTTTTSTAAAATNNMNGKETSAVTGNGIVDDGDDDDYE